MERNTSGTGEGIRVALALLLACMALVCLTVLWRLPPMNGFARTWC